MIFCFSLSFQKDVSVSYWEAECLGIDPVNKKANCRSTQDAALSDKADFSVDYDYLVIAIGASSNTYKHPWGGGECPFLEGIYRLMQYLHDKSAV